VPFGPIAVDLAALSESAAGNREEQGQSQVDCVRLMVRCAAGATGCDRLDRNLYKGEVVQSMGNSKRIWVGGLLGGVVWIVWAIIVNFVFLMPRYMAAQEAQTMLKNPRYPFFMIVWLLQFLVLGVLLASLYAGVRSSWGAGSGTAIKVGLIVGCAAGFPVNFYTAAWVPFSRVIPLRWLFELLVGSVLAALVAGWVCRER
jgi:hypothetical protein